MKFLKNIYNKIIFALNLFNNNQLHYERISNVYKEINFYYLEDFKQFNTFLCLEKYPTRKAFCQLIPPVLIIKSNLFNRRLFYF